MEFWYTAFRYNSDCMWISPILCYASLVTKLSLSGRGQVIWAPGSLKFPGFLENHDMKVTRLPALVHIKSMKILITPSGIEPATFRLVAWCLNQLCHRYLLVLVKLRANDFLYYKWKIRNERKENPCNVRRLEL